jgi:hypothetical protein
MWRRIKDWLRFVTDVMTYPTHGACAGDLAATEREARQRYEERKAAEWQKQQERAAGSSR